MNHKSSCYSLKTIKSFKLLNKREERWNNVGKTAVIFCQTPLGAIVSLLKIRKA